MPEHHNQSGMTLVELLVAMVIMGVIIAGIYNLFRVHNLMAAKQEETTLMQQELFSAMAQISDDLRMCGYTNTAGTFGFNATATNSTAVYCTKAETGAGNNTEIGYVFDPVANEIDVLINSNGTWAWETAATHISELNFIYFDANGNIIANIAANAAQIHSVDITATAIASSERSGLHVGNRTMNTRVYCRNMGI